MNLTVIILTFNSEKYIRRCLDSINKACTRFERNNIEIIIIDNDSNDATRAIAREEGIKNIVVLPDSDMGQARNLGVEMSTGKYISFLDSDDEYCRDRIDRHMNIVINNPRIDIVISKTLVKNEHYKTLSVKKFTDRTRLLSSKDYEEGKCYSLCSLTIHKEFIIKNGVSFDVGVLGRLGEDWWFQTQLACLQPVYAIDTSPGLIVNIRTDSHTQVSLQRALKAATLIRLLKYQVEYSISMYNVLRAALKFWLAKGLGVETPIEHVIIEEVLRSRSFSLIRLAVLASIKIPSLLPRRLLIFAIEQHQLFSFKAQSWK